MFEQVTAWQKVVQAVFDATNFWGMWKEVKFESSDTVVVTFESGQRVRFTWDEKEGRVKAEEVTN